MFVVAFAHKQREKIATNTKYFQYYYNRLLSDFLYGPEIRWLNLAYVECVCSGVSGNAFLQYKALGMWDYTQRPKGNVFEL